MRKHNGPGHILCTHADGSRLLKENIIQMPTNGGRHHMTSDECMLQAFAITSSARCVFSKKLDRSARICSRLVIDSLTLVSCMFEPMSKREREREREI